MKLTRRELLAAAAVAAHGGGKDSRPEYPLYSPYFGAKHSFTERDLRTIADNFEFVYGQPLSKDEMAAARSHYSGLRFIRYIGAWTVGADQAERGLRDRILYYPAASLASDIGDRDTEVQLSAIDKRKLSLRASSIGGDFSRSIHEYVTFLRIGSELMRIESFDSASGRVSVTRGFAGFSAKPHSRNATVFLPTYGVAPGKANEWESKRNISYHYDPAATARPARVNNFETVGERI